MLCLFILTQFRTQNHFTVFWNFSSRNHQILCVKAKHPGIRECTDQSMMAGAMADIQSSLETADRAPFHRRRPRMGAAAFI